MSSIGITLETGYLQPFVTKSEILAWQDDVIAAHHRLLGKTGAGSAFLGWLKPSDLAPPSLIDQVNACAKDLQDRSDAMIVVGIGGSYLGARAVIEALAGHDSKPVYFAGINLSPAYHADLMRKLKGKRTAINVISKSGTTTEPAVAFRILRDWVIRNFGAEEAAKLIVATTDEKKGALLTLARREGYTRFVVPDDVGGRFSVLSPVGLLPIAYAGIDIKMFVKGAADCEDSLNNTSLEFNPAYYYAAARNALYGKGYAVEIFSHFEPRLRFVAEWWKQLYGESEGKDGKGLFPASLDLTADLHSMGQYAQQGRRFLVETFVHVAGGEPDLTMPAMTGDLDGMNYLAGRPVSAVNNEAYRATALAHWEGGVPNSTIRLEELNARTLGALIYFYERACAVSGYLLRVNPFDQPGVEAYKRHMFALLGKPGFEEQTDALRAKVESAQSGGAIGI